MKRLIALALLLAACGSETPAPPIVPEVRKSPTPPMNAEARALIADAGVLGEHEFTNAAYSLPMQESLRNAPANEAAAKLVRAKWISLDGDGTVVLTSKAQSDKRFIVRPNGILDIVPLAKKEMGEVTFVGTNSDGTVDADFTWTWVPNEIGELFAERYAGTQNAVARMMWDGSTWVVLSVRKR